MFESVNIEHKHQPVARRGKHCKPGHSVKSITRLALGTFVTISVTHPDTAEAGKSISLAFEEIERIEGLLSVYRQDSEISILNKTGLLQNPSEDTRHVIEKAIEYSELTGGAFDISILPALISVYDNAGSEDDNSKPKHSEYLNRVDYTKIILSHIAIQLSEPGMSVTLGAIGKGYAVDKAVESLEQNGIKTAIVNAGGDIRVVGEKPGGVPWNIGIKDPVNKKCIVSVARIKDRALTTSGVYQRKSHDIINPCSGKPACEILSASVITRKAIDGDAVSTCLYILGVDMGLELIERLRGVGALVVRTDHEIIELGDWKQISAAGMPVYN